MIRINGPGDGEWIMKRVGGSPFIPGFDQSILRFRDGVPLGGFALVNYAGASIIGHMAGDPGWMSKDLIWMVFHYVFEQLGCRKFIAVANTAHPTTVAIDLRAGFEVEAVIKGGYRDGDMLFMTMTKEQCKWLKLRPEKYRSGI